MNKRYIVRLTPEEREELNKYITKGKGAASKIRHANILLKADANGANWSDEEIAQAFSVHKNTVAGIRQRFVEEGPEAAFGRKVPSTSSCQRIFDGEKEARLIALSCSEPPTGHCKWTLRLLAEKVVELKIVDSVSHETVRQTLKKNQLKPHLRKCWVIPPELNGQFVAQMEEVIDLYCQPYNPKMPVVCMDEQSRQLIKETKQVIPVQPGKPKRIDYEYERNGTANIFMFTEPLNGKRYVSVRERRTAIDWALEVKELVDVHYKNVDIVHLVCDNLNTHKIGSFYETFPPESARQLATRLTIHYTPKHGSWLNMAEIELSALTKQCLDRRIPNIETLRHEIKTWERKRNKQQKGVDWQFTTQDARIKLKHLYPKLKGLDECDLN